MPFAARRLNQVPPYVFARVAARIAAKKAEGVDVINLGIGSPDLPTPQWIVDILKRAADDPANHPYPSYAGMPAFREAVAAYYRKRFGVVLDPKTEVVPLIGSKEGIAHAAMAWVDPGDVALVADPGYPVYAIGTILAGGEVVPLPLRPENHFLPDLDAIPTDKLRRARVIWLNYPNNPTGTVASLDWFAHLVDFAREHDILVCHDNPYCDTGYDGYKAPSFLEVPGAKDVGVEFNSLSKTYNMAGWRVGMVVGNAEALEALARVKSNVDTGIPNAIQIAATAALTGDQHWLAERNLIYQTRRDIVLDGLRMAGLHAERPRASLYIWAHVPAGWTSADFAYRLLDQAGIWITPGTAFGDAGEGYLRISLCTSKERLAEAMDRLRRVTISG